MTIFHEMYGAYFRIMERLLTKPSCTLQDIRKAVEAEGFRDSVLFLPQKLQPDTPESWGLLQADGVNTFHRITHAAPPKYMTLLQKRWLKTKLSDPKMRLFLSDESLADLEERLQDVEPLYVPEMFHYFDQFSDGDDFNDPAYRQHFQQLCKAAQTGEILQISYTTRNHRRQTAHFVILNLEYSHKNNKFRAYCCRIVQGKVRQNGLLNLSRILSIQSTHQFSKRPPDRAACLQSRRCDVPIQVEVHRERNGIERFMMEFASYEKRTERDLKKDSCMVWIWYDKQDETELLIQLLGFGPVVNILGPPHFRKMAAERVKEQYALMQK